MNIMNKPNFESALGKALSREEDLKTKIHLALRELAHIEHDDLLTPTEKRIKKILEGK